MKYEVMEKLIAIPMFLVIGIHIAFLVLRSLRRTTDRRWHLFLPLTALLVYIPYEWWWCLPEVVINVPIRVDLLVLIPLQFVSFLLCARDWLQVAKQRGALAKALAAPMVVGMWTCTLAWPIFVITHFFMGMY